MSQCFDSFKFVTDYLLTEGVTIIPTTTTINSPVIRKNTLVNSFIID